MKEDVPGPGTYEIQEHKRIFQFYDIPEKYQYLGTTTKRFNEKSASLNKFYEIYDSSFGKKFKNLSPKQAEIPFSTTQERFFNIIKEQKNQKKLPSPNQYQKVMIDSKNKNMSETFQMKSKTPRFKFEKDENQQNQKPKNDLDELFFYQQQPQARTFTKENEIPMNTFNFQSKVQRNLFSPQINQGNNNFYFYEQIEESRFPVQENSNKYQYFQTTEKRFKEQDKIEREQNTQNETSQIIKYFFPNTFKQNRQGEAIYQQKPQDIPFGSKMPKILTWQPMTDNIPGPSDYQDQDILSKKAKKSFNILFKQGDIMHQKDLQQNYK